MVASVSAIPSVAPVAVAVSVMMRMVVAERSAEPYADIGACRGCAGQKDQQANHYYCRKVKLHNSHFCLRSSVVFTATHSIIRQKRAAVLLF